MDNFYLSALVEEVRPLLLKRKLAKISLTDADLLLDFRLPDDRLLRVSFDPSWPALYLEKSAKVTLNDAHPFLTTVKKELVGARLLDLQKPALERIVCLEFEKVEAEGRTIHQTLVGYFTGRTANAFLLDEHHVVEASLNTRGNKTLRFGDQFQMPKPAFDLQRLVKELPEDISEPEILERFFNHQAVFSPQLEKEFLARCQSATPKEALQALTTDLLTNRPQPLLFWRFPIEQVGAKRRYLPIGSDQLTVAIGESIIPNIVNLKTDLQLSHFPLQSAKNQIAKNQIKLLKPTAFQSANPETKPTEFQAANSEAELTEFQSANSKTELAGYELKSLSDAAFCYAQIRQHVLQLQRQRQEVHRFVHEEIRKKTNLLEALETDRHKYEDPERFKKFGDLLLANFNTARMRGTKALVIDYYDPEQSWIEIELGNNMTLPQAATQFFTRSQKARRALLAIAELEAALKPKLEKLSALRQRFDEDLSAPQIEEIKSAAEILLGIKPQAATRNAPAKKANKQRLGRRFLASYGFEIVVGKNDKENDTITFRLAGSQDLWMHAADYPGSHVVVRNPSRQEIPAKVIQEAAEIAAYFSQAKAQNKVAVHYTQKKFITKPPRAKPGLVRLSSFKTILVEPRCMLKKIEQ
ncbi:MAG: NFACT family protein [Acidobacteria bacterium]|nr:NFACT family protein [Acidobacteriota bacterium]